MDPKLQRRVQRYGWDRAVAAYEDLWARQIRPAHVRLIDVAALGPGERVIDVACGTGLATFPAAALVGPDGAVVGTDLSEGMVVAAREEAARLGFANVRFDRMDAEQLELEDASFDAALCVLGLMYVPDPIAALREMRRVLRHGGRAAVVVWGERAKCGWGGIFPIVDARVGTEVCPLFFDLGTGDALVRAVDSAGFRDVRAERFDTLMPYVTGAEACAAAFEGGPVALAWSRFDEATRAAVRAEYLASIQPYQNGGGYQIPGEFVMVTGRVA